MIAIAPNYRGQVDDLKAQPLPSSRGWRVAEGAVDTNAVAQLFDKTCLKGKGHNVLYSVSMGGNTAGLALAAKPKRLGGTAAVGRVGQRRRRGQRAGDLPGRAAAAPG